MPEIEMTGLAADLSARGMRERAFRRECQLIAQMDEVKARRARARASRLPLRSNGRAKLTAKAEQLETHAGLMLAAAARPEAA